MDHPGFIKQHPILTFYFLTYAISWGGIVITLGYGGIPQGTFTTGENDSFHGCCDVGRPSPGERVADGDHKWMDGLPQPFLARDSRAETDWRVRSRGPDCTAGVDDRPSCAFASVS